MDIKTIQTCAKGMTIDRVVGIVTKVGKKNSGTGQYGDWSIQPITLKDETGEIGIALNNQTFEPKIGDKISISAIPSEKHGLTGIKVDEYEGKKQLRVTKTAVISTGEVKPEPKPESKPEVKSEPKNDLPDWDNINLIKNRCMAVSYAKDLAVAGKINVCEINNQAESIVRYFYKGIEPLTHEQEKMIESEANNEETIPF